MKKALILIAAIVANTALFAATQSPRQSTTLEQWSFINEDFQGAERIDADLQRWKSVSVPHDWAIGKHFDMNIDKQMVKVVEDGDKVPQLRTGRTGALPVFNVGWYRCNADLGATAGKNVSIEFDGAMSEAKVYLNGKFIGEHPYGYSSFRFDITDEWQSGKKNTIAVRLQNREQSSRWYPGAGIYRNVRLVVTEPVHVAHWGTYITTPKVSKSSATVNVKTDIANFNNEKLELLTSIYDANGKQVAKSNSKIKGASMDQNLKISKPVLWSPEQPNLYNVVSQIFDNKVLVDEYHTTMGVRTIEFDNNRGFLLNGEVYKIKGVCMHHDLGPLGAAVNYRATERQLEIMKEMGANAIRTSHNPPSLELLEICDKMGLLVQVESFDEWKVGKNINGYNRLFDEWVEQDLSNMIRRDRNHPSVIMWSIGNEVREQGKEDGAQVAQYLTDICHKLDPTRPVTSGFNGHTAAIKNGLADVVDLVGFNYKPHDYVPKHKAHPEMIIYGSETASTISSRGDYKFPAKVNNGRYSYPDYTMSSYDLDCVKWGSTPDFEFASQEDNDFIFGEFVWTGFDYLGEPTPYYRGTPARSSYFGIVDLVGFKKDRFFLYQSHWSQEPMLHMLPHWNWEERTGKKVPVFCYSNYPEVELFVNGKSQGKKSKQPKSENVYERYRLMWNDVVYQPGEIKAVAYDAEGNIAETKVIKTAGEPKTVKMTPDRAKITADGKDISYITIDIVDAEGNFCPRANDMLFITVEGDATLKAICNGSPIEQIPFSSNYMRAYNGKLMVIVQSTKNAGTAKIFVSCEHLKSQSVEITTK